MDRVDSWTMWIPARSDGVFGDLYELKRFQEHTEAAYAADVIIRMIKLAVDGQ